MLRTLRDLTYRAVGVARRRASLERCILVNGSPRSGTTWLGEWLYRAAEGHVSTGEILNDRRLPDWSRRYGFTNRPYRAPDRDDPAFLGALEDLFAGRYVAPHIYQRRELAKLVVGRPVVTKIITGNLLLPWLAPRMPQLRIVQIVRNPAAVIASQIAYPPGDWLGRDAISPEYDPFLNEHPDYARPQEKFGTIEEVLAAHWSLEHRYLLEQRDRWSPVVHFVRYEDLVHDREAAFRGVAKFLGIAWSPALLDATKRESKSVQVTSALKSGGDPTKQYAETLGPERLARIERVLERFGRPFYEQQATA